MKIFLCRHGQTTGDIEDRYGGAYDDSLSKKGVKESKELAKKLQGLGIQLVVHSSLKRAKETALIVSKELGTDVKEKPEFCERNNYGVLTGLKKTEAIERFPKEVAKLKINPIRHEITGSENYDVFKKRVLDIFLHISKCKHHSIVAIITHGGPIRCIVRELLKLGEIKNIEDCAILEIESTENCFSLVAVDGIELANPLE